MSKEPISGVEAVRRLWDVARANPIPGIRPSHARELESDEPPSQVLGLGFYLSWERGWGVDAKLRVHGDVDRSTGMVAFKVEVGWSSSTYAPAAARVAGDLHAKVGDLACWMQMVIDSLPPVVDERD